MDINVPVNSLETTTRLYDEIESKIEYFINEYDLNYTDIFGVLELVKMNYYMDLNKKEDEE